MGFDFDWIGVGGLAYDLVLSVDRLPIADEKYSAELVGKLPGGFVANATCAAARLGLRAGYVGWVGDDDEGDMLVADFVAWGVNPAGLVRVRGERTPFTVVITDRAGGRAILLPPSPLYHLSLASEQLEGAARARVVYSFPRDGQWCRQLRGAAQQSGALLALDVENTPGLSGAELRDLLLLADVAFISERALGGPGLRSLGELAAPRQWIIMTAGSRGAYGMEGGMRQPAFRPALDVPALDTTGAGDCFHAALLAARLDGAALEEALAFANAAAAIKVQHRGARGGLPTRAEVEGARR
jgi:sugar/nucleoside kinase (ribokinase family)